MGLSQVCNDLANRFYDCVAGGDDAGALLGDVTETLGFEVGSLVSVSHTARGDEVFCTVASGIDLEICQKAERKFGVSARTVLRDGSPMPMGSLQDRETLISRERLQQEAFFEEFSRPNRLTEGCKMLLYRAQDRSIFINFGRPLSGFDPRNRQQAIGLLGPHMVRSTLLQVKLDQTDALRRLCWASVNLCPYPVVVLDNNEGVFLANGRAEERIRGDGLDLTRDGLRAITPAENHRLQQCIRRVIACSESGAPIPRDNEVRVTRPSGKRPYRLVVMPVQAERQPLGRRPAAIVVLFDLDDARHASVERCREVFGLTRSEAEVAIGVMLGQSPEQIAARYGRSLGTVRNLLKRVFVKTGVNRQSELTRLMLLSPVLTPGVPDISGLGWDPFALTGAG